MEFESFDHNDSAELVRGEGACIFSLVADLGVCGEGDVS